MQRQSMGLRSKYTALFQMYKHGKALFLHTSCTFVQERAIFVCFYAFVMGGRGMFLCKEGLRFAE